ncbi:hypothetical protein fugu_005805 [Takifugu bimaculatus]|uniref:Leukemia NUP98 fusion partner 1 n=1 Tax=Takifugu bimaculatus TaxID=433685 RepID=A0A4Z2B5F0_9TELE|nr:hypothetical protein fugu_005805 [Takifugu bimaculatus]
MSLRLLPAFGMDNDDDDDGNFTKWMSSYWGHGAEVGPNRERKRSFRRSAKTHHDRRASLPTVSQLDAMKLNRLHAATTAPSPSHIRPREEKVEVRTHQRARRVSSADNTQSKSAIQENRITTIPEITESFEKRLCLHDKKTAALNDDKKSCLICHEDIRKNGGGVQKLQFMHHLHKEVVRRLQHPRPRSGSEAAVFQAGRLSDERRKSADGNISMEKELRTPQRQSSLRRHR